MSETKKNPSEYGYAGDEKIVFSVAEYSNVLRIIDFILDKETEKKTPYKYKYINRETGDEIKKVTEKNQHLAVKVVDIEKTLSSDKVLALSPDGIEVLRVKMMLQGIHINNIESGVAKHYTELQALAEAEKAKAAEFLASQQEDAEAPVDSTEAEEIAPEGQE